MNFTSSTITCTAQYAYTADNPFNQLTFPEGAIIVATAGQEPGWWWGTYQCESGYFPSSYVLVDDVPRPPEAEETPKTSNKQLNNKRAKFAAPSPEDVDNDMLGTPMGSPGRGSESPLQSPVSTFGSSSIATRGYGQEGVVSPGNMVPSDMMPDTAPPSPTNQYRFVKGVLVLPAGHTYVQKYESEAPRQRFRLNASKKHASSRADAPVISIVDRPSESTRSVEEYVTLKETRKTSSERIKDWGKMMRVKDVGKNLRLGMKGRKVGTF
jgi:hypothetical protein